ncbi:MAG: dihydroneopterin aldolase [Streptococcaceae bacterium]|jgi:dihydroneopterin aldolase|nr:dihydroneopterin aldolase [Streptococcaceae bacterium]
MYRIKINNMKFHSYIGVYPEEKKLGQNIEIDLVVKINDFVKADHLKYTISYSDFYQIVSEIVASSRVDLVETLAQEIISSIKELDRNKITQVSVRIRKLAVPIDGIFDSVEIEMEG